ncbi:MAG: DNA translocase FtsK 4TM domain-containing protein [Candidatus Moranbacteria bacterium]|nr:DNA translocase FtsK 4TM domain-containing protein [Candidatus Moranbacteria bacterium]
MGRKKKVDKLAEELEQEKSNFEFDIAGDAKRSVAAVFLFALAVVILLGFFGKAGVVGQSLDSATGLTTGWAKWIFPVFLVMGGIVLLLRKETAFYVTKIIGLILTFVSLTGFFHWFFDVKKMAEVAGAGSGGGYVGYGVAYFATTFFGVAGGMVMIMALFLIGIIVAFNFSIFHFIQKLFTKSEVASEVEFVEENEDESEEDEIIGSEMEEVVETKQEKKSKEDENIGKIEFVEGPDRFVDEKLFDKLSDGVAKVKKSLTRKKKEDADDDWQLPPMDLLEKNSSVAKGGDIEKNAEIIEKTLHQFGIEVERGAIQTGPSVTQFSFRPAVGVKISRILALQDDLALALAKHPIRIEAPIPGKSLIGIEVPNKDSAIVRMRNVLESEQFVNRKNNLMIALGEDVSGQYIFGDLAKMPHLLVAGATGTGKSVGINSIITALLYQNSPKDLKMIMVDPKRVELSLYNGIPHLLSEVIVENGKVINALKWAVGEMERRYRQLQDTGSRDIVSYNEKAVSEKTRKITDPETGEVFEQEMDKLPYIVIVIDELADLMGTHGKEVEGAIIRLAQMARAVGIHLILSTQKPIVTVITSLIKSNISTRIAFRVPSLMDSRTILDASGAEKLLGNGDMLYLSANSPKPKRIQGVFISEAEVKKIVKFVKDQKIETAEQEIGEDITKIAMHGETNLDFKNSDDNNGAQDDDLYEAAKSEVEKAGKASASLLQRRLRVGYARAARLLDILEDKGIVGPSDGAKPREVYTAENKPQYDDVMTDQGERDKWQI